MEGAFAQSESTAARVVCPYATFAHFEEVIRGTPRYHTHDLLDVDHLQHLGLSQYAAGRVVAALRCFHLVDAEFHPTMLLLRLENPAQEFSELCRRLLGHYSMLEIPEPLPADFDLVEYFRVAAPEMSDVTVRKVAAFYRGLRKAAGEELPRQRRRQTLTRVDQRTRNRGDTTVTGELADLSIRQLSALTTALERLASVAAPTAEWTAALRVVEDALERMAEST